MTVLLPLWLCIDPSIDSALDVHPLLKLIFPILFPVYILLLTLLLFRLLGSTAENYFSPALEMLSSELRIVSTALETCGTGTHILIADAAPSTSRSDAVGLRKWSARCERCGQW